MPDTTGPGNNIYTVLTLVAAVSLLIAVVYTWYRFSVVFGTWNPFG